MKERKQAEQLAKSAPVITDKEHSEINAAYTAYIFRQSKTRLIWTTCCGKHEEVPKQEYSDRMHAVMVAKHQAEPRNLAPYSSAHVYYPPGTHEKDFERTATPCPYCGAEAYVKELGKTGRRDNLVEYKRFAVLRWYRGALWAVAYYTWKKYTDINNLTAKPELTRNKVYRFKPNEALCAYWNYYDEPLNYINKLTERPEKLPLKFYEPFTYNSAEGSGYTLVGKDEVNKSPFKYCRFDQFVGDSNSAMRFLAVCCIFPRQVEMLMKAGMYEVVDDLVRGRKWNAAAFNWSEADPLESFNLDRNEMKEYLSGENSLEALAFYKQLRRKKIKCNISEVQKVVDMSPFGKNTQVIKRIKDNGIKPKRWVEYISRETEALSKVKQYKEISIYTITQFWIDYIDNAVVLGYDLTNPLVQMPKGIKKKHDDAVRAAAPIIKARRTENLNEQELRRVVQVDKKYGFSLNGYIIRAPIDTEEIVEEGKALKHCVGGYAERHMNGKLAILFFRSEADPHLPLATIEMKGNKLIQIHGYDNDIKKKIMPLEKYANIIDPWLEWLKTGSKRDKDGKPIIRKKRQPKQKPLLAEAS